MSGIPILYLLYPTLPQPWLCQYNLHPPPIFYHGAFQLGFY